MPTSSGPQIAPQGFPPRAKPPPVLCPAKMIVFTINLLVGLTLSQLIGSWFEPEAYAAWRTMVKICTMFCLSYIMIHVGYEFDIDKTQLGAYGKDYLIAMTAAGFPWLFVAGWFIFVLPHPLPWDDALVAARFAAPTSAGILFSMLEASGMKDTWLFKKARVLAIFDDLDTILLMVPLKVIKTGLKWELAIDLTVLVVLLGLMWVYMHRIKIPCSWRATACYAALVTTVCEVVHFVTHSHEIDPYDVVDTVHLEVLLPAFAVGVLARCGHHSQAPLPPAMPRQRAHSYREKLARRGSLLREQLSRDESEDVNSAISAVFMALVGLSMPALFGADASAAGGGHRMLLASSTSSGSDVNATLDEYAYNASLDTSSSGSGVLQPAAALSAAQLVLHVLCVSVLMVLGKLFPTFCYRDEADMRTRFALSLGMCPRGEVGAGVIVMSLGFGIGGSAITVAVICLALNLVASSLFILAVKKLANEPSHAASPKAVTGAGDGDGGDTPEPHSPADTPQPSEAGGADDAMALPKMFMARAQSPTSSHLTSQAIRAHDMSHDLVVVEEASVEASISIKPTGLPAASAPASTEL